MLIKEKAPELEEDFQNYLNWTAEHGGNEQEARELFERLWKLYPNKRGKGQVSDIQKTRLLAVGEPALVKAIERYSTELQKDASWRKPQNGNTFFVAVLLTTWMKTTRLEKKFLPLPTPTKTGFIISISVRPIMIPLCWKRCGHGWQSKESSFSLSTLPYFPVLYVQNLYLSGQKWLYVAYRAFL